MDHHHQALMPQLAPYVGDEDSWSVCRGLYETLLAKPDSVLLLAYDGPDLVGYGLAHVMDTADTWIPDTWKRGARVGEIESLAVRTASRGRGIGTALLDALHAALAANGVHDVILGVLAGNHAAQRLYERHGYRPTWLHLSRSSGTPSQARIGPGRRPGPAG
ncbi:MAG: hypothetical protein DLM56_04640 [Pseudonocardiales bacterium]|nr:MAG: hypothetical protein DLM56_04640 [Pseudonocardiales bacterium]